NAIRKYTMSPTTARAKNQSVVRRSCSNSKVNSLNPTRYTIELPFSRCTHKFVREGSISAHACGKITRRILCGHDMDSATVASHCPCGTEVKDARTASAP